MDGTLMQDKVAIVTGAGRGIGRGEAIELARHGAAVVVNELDAEAGRAVVEEIVAAGGRATLNADDCCEFAGAERLVRQAVEEFGQLDALVNNAGIVRDRTVAKMTEEEWDAVIKVHLKGISGRRTSPATTGSPPAGRVTSCAPRPRPACSATSARRTTAPPRPASRRSRRSSRRRWPATA
jgi:NAD(P)-dependent dehydrogenase (short-subunit alcohol dehydrogenase family)